MTILALDLATNLGACWGEASARPQLGHHRLPSTGDDVGAFLCAYEDWLEVRIDEVEATVIIFEAPVLPRPKWNKVTKKLEGGVSIQTTRKLQGLAGVTEMIATRRNLLCREAQPAEVKQALAGKGNAKKPEMVRAARALGFAPHVYTQAGEEASDEADALGVWLSWVRVRHPQQAAAWLPLFAQGNLP